MRQTILTAVVIAAVASFSARAQSGRPAAAAVDSPGSEARCAALTRLELPDLIAIDATVVAAGPFTPPGPADAEPIRLPAFCRVAGTVRPAIRFEVWLPFADAWNGRFQAVGGGGFAGVISYRAMARALTGGYVTASTDTGHVAGDLDWLDDPRLLRDYGFRAIFEMTAKAKAAIARFYDRPADFNYFNGCSTGGRQGLMEAQRFPDDYDGIVAGAPVNIFVDTHISQLWAALASKRFGDTPDLDEADLALVANSVIAQCDARDGLSDGLIDDPRGCGFDPAVLQCRFGQSGDCLSADQVDSVRRIYAGPSRSDTGEPIAHGFEPGGERTWSVVSSIGLVPIPQAFFSRVVFDNPAWDWRTFDFAADVDRAREVAAPMLDATDPDLGRFRERGGKLIVYHGWNDQVIPPEGSIDYHAAVAAELARQDGLVAASADEFFRLFMVPGMTHCAGGIGPDRFDAQSAIEDWVERNVAPDRIDARHDEPGNAFGRPLCPYPLHARYRGTGDRARASSFVCAQ